MKNSCPKCSASYRTGAKFCPKCGTSIIDVAPASSVGLKTGQVMRGQYTIVRKLGKGGMGAVYLATETIANKQRQVVIKEMLDYYNSNNPRSKSQAHKRFEAEAATLVTLSFHGIPQIFAFFSENNHNYIVMQFIQGRNLESKLTHEDEEGILIKGQPYLVEEVRPWAIHVCEILEHLSSQNIVHMDIKPSNLIVDNSGKVWLVDFGTAKAEWVMQVGGDVGLQKSSIYGTAGYAPPEQHKGEAIPRSDVYALASTMYHLLTNDDPRKHPFQFPKLDKLPDNISIAMREALRQDVDKRLTAIQFRKKLALQPKSQLQPKTMPVFRWKDGTLSGKPQDLVQPALTKWEEAGGYFDNGDWERWFNTIHRNDLLSILTQAKKKHKQVDMALDAFLRHLDPNLSPPRLKVSPAVLDFGSVPRGESGEMSIQIVNSGKSFMAVKIENKAKWLNITPTEFPCPPGHKQIVKVETVTDNLDADKPYKTPIRLQAGVGGEKTVPATVTVPAARLKISPPTLDFGSVYRGQELDYINLQISNTGASYLEAELVASAHWLSIKPEKIRCEPNKLKTVKVSIETDDLDVHGHQTAVVEINTQNIGQVHVTAGVTTSVFKETMHWLMDTRLGCVFSMIPLILLVFVGMRTYQYIYYSSGMNNMAKTQWKEARASFERVDVLPLAYKDTSEKIKESYYQAGLAYLVAGDWANAQAELEGLKALDANYKDIDEQLKESYYQAGTAYLAVGDKKNGLVELQKIADPGYKDTARKLAEALAGEEIVYVTGGEFRMGSDEGAIDERPVHTVVVNDFWMDKLEVTNIKYAQYLNSLGEHRATCYEGNDCIKVKNQAEDSRITYQEGGQYVVDSGYEGHPVTHVSWYGALSYCLSVSGQLPTEAEWEYAARGPAFLDYPWGSGAANDSLLNYAKTEGDTITVGTYPGGSSWVGVQDMSGNVWEWVSDWYNDGYYSTSPGANPGGPVSGQERVARGGGWNDESFYVRASVRHKIIPASTSNNIGFRCIYKQ